jgi:hypothetical protein
MANTKISALPASTTPLAGTEVLPIVQSGATVKVAVSDLTAGRSVSATEITLTTGNLIVASGQGVDFSATSSGSGTMTSKLLSDYEEGTWTPLVAFGGNSVGLTTVVSSGKYTKIGNIVYYAAEIYFTNKGSSTGAATVTGLPFAISSMAMAAPSTIFNLSITAVNFYSASGTSLALFVPGTGGGVTATDANFTNSSGLVITGMYFI